MELKQFYGSEGEIPSEVKEFYVERDNRWILHTEPQWEDVTSLKTALASERNLRRDAEKQATDLKTKFEGIEPDEVTRLRDRVKDLDESEIYDKKGIDALVAKRTQSMQEEHQRVLAVKDRELAVAKRHGEEYEGRWRSDRIKTVLLDTAARAGVTKQAMQDAVQRGLAVFTGLDEHGNVLAKVGDDLKYGKDGISPLSPDEWITGLKAEAPHLWPPSSGGGAGTTHGSVNGGIDYAKISSPTERLTRFREQQAAQNRRG